MPRKASGVRNTWGDATSVNNRWPPPRVARAPGNTPTLRFRASASLETLSETARGSVLSPETKK